MARPDPSLISLHVSARDGRLAGQLTFREHLVVGDMLSRIRDDLMTLACRLQRAYGVKHKTFLAVHAAQARLETLRDNLDCKVCGECPDDIKTEEGVGITWAYYGWRRRLAEVTAYPIRKDDGAGVAHG
jgi:hypothetical protein